MKKKVLVTGGAGFIGSHIVDALIEGGFDVAVVDNLSTGKLENVNKKARFYKVDIKSKDLERIFQKEQPNFVNHHAAHIDLRESVDNPIKDIETNVIGMINLLECCRKYKVEKVVFASTGGALYSENKIPAYETSQIKPKSPYGINKLFGEIYLDFYNKTYGLNYVCLRYANVFGPRQNAEGEAGVVSIFTTKMLANIAPAIYGDGLQERDFVFVGDVVDANISAIESVKGVNQAFNISSCTSTSVNTIYHFLKKTTGYAGGVLHSKPRKGEVRRMILNYDKAKNILGWSPKTNV
ncbi:MAG: NAD-dependent epimerase/dehydratase family protein [archaeon]